IAKIYHNGVKIDEWSAGTSYLVSSSDMWSIGRRHSSETYAGDYFNGTLDEVRIYDRSLTPSEIMALYEKGSGDYLVGYWNFSEGLGTMAQDSSGNGNDGIIYNTNTGIDNCTGGCSGWTTNGKFGYGMQFDGVNDYVDVGDIGLGTTRDLTISFWVNQGTPLSWRDVLSFGWTSFRFETSTSVSDWTIYSPGIDTNEIDFPTDWIDSGTWRHVAFTSDVNNWYVYIDGVQRVTGTTDGDFTGGDLYFGCRIETNYCYNGILDEVRIYRKALSAAEIQAIYAEGNYAGNLTDYPIKVEKGVVGSWHFSENAGTQTKDSSGHANNGTLGNSTLSTRPTWTTGKIGQALEFDGGDFVEIPHSDDFLISDGTVELWFKTDDPTKDQGLISKDSEGYDTGGHLTINVDPASYIYIRQQSTTASYAVNSSTSVTLLADTWYHVAYTFGSAGMKLYIDGTEVDTDSYTGGLTGNYEPIALGAKTVRSDNLIIYPLQSYLDGTIDEVRIYNYALSASEIQAIYAVSNPVGDLTDYQIKVEKNLVGSWHFSENAGTTAKDSSGNGNDAVLPSAPSQPQWTGGIVGNALKFDGIDDYVDIGNPSSLQLTGAITLEAWVKWNGTENPYFVTKTGDSTHRSYDLSGNVDGTVEFRVGGTSCNIIQSSGGLVVPADEWIHLAGVYEPSGYIRLYVDGSIAKENTTSVPSSQCENGLNWFIGAREGNQGFSNGTIDEVRIYNRTLSPDEIRAHYEAGLANHYADEDYRYINTSATSVLSHWSENDNIDWVKVPLIKSGEITPVYLYYGNPAVTNISDGYATFEFFDDFEVDLSKWTQTATSTTSEINRVMAQAESGSYSAEVYQTFDDGDTALLKSFPAEETDREVRMYFYDDGASIVGYRHFLITRNNPVQTYIGVYSTYPSTYTYRIRLDIGSLYSDTGIPRSIGWHEFMWRIFAGKTDGFIDGAQIFSTPYMLNMSEIGIVSYWDSRPGFYNDLAIVRKYVSPEPEITISSPSGDITRGELTSVDITPASISGWDRFYASNTTPAGTSITYEILNASNSVVLCPLISGNGDDISSCASTAPSVRLHSVLSTTDSSVTPEIYLWNITWFPASLPAGNGTIEGTVSNATGPLDNVLITASNATHSYINYTGISGQYTLNIPPSTYQVTASKIGYIASSANTQVVSAATKTQDFVLQQPLVTEVITDAVVYFTSSKKSTINMGTRSRITVYVKNPKDNSVIVPLHIGSSDQTFRNLIQFENTGRRDMDIKLGPREERYVPIEVFAGRTGSYDLIIGPDDVYGNKYDEMSVIIINRDASLFSNTSGLRLLAIALIVALAAILLYGKSSGSQRKVRPHTRRNRSKSK
ncbi:MAG: DUF2341 domain-containing protein, partial [archaeon]